MSIRTVSVLAGCLMLGGCFEMEQEFVFNPDKTATATLRLIMHASLRSMVSERLGQDTCIESQSQEDGIAVTVTSSSRDADSVCTFTISGDIDKVAKALSELEFGLSADQHSFISLSSNDDLYSLEITLPNSRKLLGIGDKPLEEVFPPYIFSDIAQRELSWTVAAPAIGYTNGLTESKDRVATFKRSLRRVLSQDDPIRFKVNFFLNYRTDVEQFNHVENSYIYYESLDCASQVTKEYILNDLYDNAKFTHKWHGDGDFEEIWNNARMKNYDGEMDNEYCSLMVSSHMPLSQKF